MTNYYEELKLDGGLSAKELQENLIRLEIVWTERASSRPEKAAETLVLINQAKKVFASEASKAEYDRELSAPTRAEEAADPEAARKAEFKKWRTTAQDYFARGENDMAKTALERALPNADENDFSFLNLAAQICKNCGEYQAALSYINKAILIAPDLAELYLTKALVLNALRLEEVRQRFGNPEAHFKQTLDTLRVASKKAKAQGDTQTQACADGALAFNLYFNTPANDRDTALVEQLAKEAVRNGDIWGNGQRVLDDLAEKRAAAERAAQEEQKRREELARKERERREAAERAEQERREAEERAEQEKRKAAAKKRRRRRILIAFVAVIAACFVLRDTIRTAYVRWRTEAERQSKYSTAESYFLEGEYEAALEAFSRLGDYKDSQERALETEEILKAEAEREAEEQAKAAYAAAEEKLAEGDRTAAAMLFGSAGDYQDARERSLALWDGIVKRQTIDAGFNNTIALKTDGTVVAIGNNEYGQCNVEGLTDTISVVSDFSATYALKADGTVESVGDNTFGEIIDAWTDIVTISAYLSTIACLKSDGTIDGISGTEEWTDIIAVDVGSGHVAGLRSDGTVVASGENDKGQCDVEGWSDIVEIAVGTNVTIGLKSDGTVVATGNRESGACDVEGWTDIIAIGAGWHYTVGLKSDGTVVATGFNRYGACNVDNWTDIVAISAGDEHVVGLRSDGTAVATEWLGEDKNYYYGECDVSGWSDIQLPNN